VDAVPYYLLHGRPPKPLVELEQCLDESASSFKGEGVKAYAEQLQMRMVDAVLGIKEVQIALKKRIWKEDPPGGEEVLKKGDLIWLFDPTMPRKDGVKYKRMWKFWKGPYFVLEVMGPNVKIVEKLDGKSQVVHRNRVRKYRYPLRGLGVEGQRREGYLLKVVGEKQLKDGRKKYRAVWRTLSGDVLDWVEEGIVPYQLVKQYLEELELLAGGEVPVNSEGVEAGVEAAEEAESPKEVEVPPVVMGRDHPKKKKRDRSRKKPAAKSGEKATTVGGAGLANGHVGRDVTNGEEILGSGIPAGVDNGNVGALLRPGQQQLRRSPRLQK